MFSVDNFYTVLQNNLLDPLKIDGWYCYPFGTSNLLRTTSLTNYTINNNAIQIVFWDQEPLNLELLQSSLEPYTRHLCYKDCMVLANSDRCQDGIDSGMLDWNYFFHGFAALDWFHDLYYLTQHKSKFDKVFITVNRIVTQERSYRLGLVADLLSRGLGDKGLISCSLSDTYGGTWKNEIFNPQSKLSYHHKRLVLDIFSKLPENLTLDNDVVPGSASAFITQDQIELFNRAFLHVITETMYYPEKLHLTEKIFRPIVFKRPFVLAGCVGNLAYLKRYGFQTFNRWWDESYDQETDNEKRLTKIANIVEHLSTLSIADLQDMYQEMLPVLEHNFQHFYGKFKQIIVTEMLDNYTQVLDQYNSKNRLFYDYTTVNIPHLKKHWSQ
jgi:hypothetical protein